MPRAAIDTGMVDLVLRAGGDRRQARASSACRSRMPATTFADEHDGGAERQLREVFDLLRPVSGVDFRHYKLPTIKRRLFRRMALHRLTDVGDYIQLLESDAERSCAASTRIC